MSDIPRPVSIWAVDAWVLDLIECHTDIAIDPDPARWDDLCRVLYRLAREALLTDEQSGRESVLETLADIGAAYAAAVSVDD